jgi:hypothetical protein
MSGHESAAAPDGMDETWRRRGPFICGVCRDVVQVGVEHVATLAGTGPSPNGRDGLCGRHLRDLLARVPGPGRAGIVASLLEGAAGALAEGREIPNCAACSRQEEVARRPPSGSLCLRHLRSLSGRLTWDALRSHAVRLTSLLERGRGRAMPAALWGSDGLVGMRGDDGACSICAARTEARVRQYEWLADAVHRFPAQAAGAAVATCGPHGWWMDAFSSGSRRMLVELAAEEWARRLRWLLAGLEHRPRDRLAARVAALPATLADLSDDEGRLHIAAIVGATAAAVLRTPAAVLAHLTAVALGTVPCPVCAAEDRAARKAAASSDAVVCAWDVDLVRSATPDRRARHALGRATAGRLRREAALLRGGGVAVDGPDAVRVLGARTGAVER